MELIDQIANFFTFSHIMVLVYVLNALIAFGLVFIDNKSPTATLAWIMLLFMLPVVGLILYLILSQNIARQQIFRMTEEEKFGISTILGWQKESVKAGISASDNEVTNRWRGMISMNLEYADSLLMDN
ncbi:MAG: PLDc N-terminal domain-containing protein, partial [Mogibacterium sp.]|nr:PLDc N-terminal domain-containing protein [Mogibacterium sp.]